MPVRLFAINNLFPSYLTKLSIIDVLVKISTSQYRESRLTLSEWQGWQDQTGFKWNLPSEFYLFAKYKDRLCREQCDQMATVSTFGHLHQRLFAQWHTKFAMVGPKISQIINKPSKFCQIVKKIPNLVTLLVNIGIGSYWDWRSD